MTFALFAPSPADPSIAVGLPLVAANESDANLAGFSLATTGRLTGLCIPGHPYNEYLVAYDHNGSRLTVIAARAIQEAEDILTSCLECGIVEEVKGP